MQKDFKGVYDPENPVNHEISVTAAAGGDAIKAVAKGAEFSARNTTAAAFAQGAGGFNPNAGFLVGPTEGGTFGRHHFDEFYRIFRLKEYYDAAKQEADDLNKSGDFSNAKSVGDVVGGVVRTAGRFVSSGLAAGANFANGSFNFDPGTAAVAYAVGRGLRSASTGIDAQIRKFDRRTDKQARAASLATTRAIQNMNPAVRSMVLANLGGGAAYWGWEVGKGYKEGGVRGAVANPLGSAASLASQMATGTVLNVGFGYTTEGGFSTSVDVGFGPQFAKDINLRVSGGVEFSEFGGFGPAYGGVSLNLTEHFSIGARVYEGGGTSFNLGFTGGLQDNFDMGALGDFNKWNTGLTYSNIGPNGPTYGLNFGITGYGRDQRGTAGAGVFQAALMGGITYNERNGYGGSFSYAQGLESYGMNFNSSGVSAYYQKGFTGNQVLDGLSGAWDGVSEFLGLGDGGFWEKAKNWAFEDQFATNEDVALRKIVRQHLANLDNAIDGALSGPDGTPRIELTQDVSGAVKGRMLLRHKQEEEVRAVYWGRGSKNAIAEIEKQYADDPERREELIAKVKEWRKEWGKNTLTKAGLERNKVEKKYYTAMYKELQAQRKSGQSSNWLMTGLSAANDWLYYNTNGWVGFEPSGMKQIWLEHPNRQWACNFTTKLDLLQGEAGKKLDINEVFKAAHKKGIINDNMSVQDTNALAKLVGANVTWKSHGASERSDWSNIIKTQLATRKNKRVQIWLQGPHAESITGVTKIDGKEYFKLHDPGFQKDTHLDPVTWRPGRFVNGRFRPSRIKGDGPRRRVTSIGYFR